MASKTTDTTAKTPDVSSPATILTVTQPKTDTAKVEPMPAPAPAPTPAPTPSPAPSMILGINPEAPSPWDALGLFANLANCLPPFSMDRPTLKLDAAGYPIGLADGDAAGIQLSGTEPYPAGVYQVGADGKGSIWFEVNYTDGTFDNWGSSPPLIYDFKGGTSTPLRPLNIRKPAARIFVRWSASDPTGADYLKNFKLIQPGCDGTSLFHPAALKLIAAFPGPVRYLDWFAANNPPNPDGSPAVAHWSDRNQSFTCFQNSGVRYEVIWALSNATMRPPWVCIPDTADDDYVQQLARQADAALDPSLPIYLEFSNEVWNNGKPQYARVVAAGLAAGFSSDPVQAGRKWYGRRAGQVFAKFKAALGPNRKLIRVISGFSPFPDVAGDAITQLRADGGGFDALAFAPYFFAIDYSEDQIIADLANGKPQADIVAAILDSCFRCISGFVADTTKGHKVLADRYSVPLLCYECGQGLMPETRNENNTKYVDTLILANRDGRMGDLYRRYFDTLDSGGVSIACHLALRGAYTKSGMWGLAECRDQDLATAPKARAVAGWLADHPIPGPGPEPGPTPVPTPIPTPTPVPIPPPTPINPAVVRTTELLAVSRAKRQALEAANKAVVDAQAAVTSAQAAVATAQAAVASADAAVVSDLTTNGAFVDSTVSPPVVYLADPSSPGGYRAVTVRSSPVPAVSPN
jgi:hypothetical protein